MRATIALKALDDGQRHAALRGQLPLRQALIETGALYIEGHRTPRWRSIGQMSSGRTSSDRAIANCTRGPGTNPRSASRIVSLPTCAFAARSSRERPLLMRRPMSSVLRRTDFPLLTWPDVVVVGTIGTLLADTGRVKAQTGQSVCKMRPCPSFQDSSQPRPLSGPAQHNAERAENQRSSIGHASRFRTGCQMTAMRYGLRVEASHNFPGEGCA
jgi:hypothetical protein